MKRMVSYITILAVVLFSTGSFAASPVVEKFSGGVRDIVTSPLEVSDHVKAETANGNFLPFALPGGLLKGGFYMTKKMVTGVYHVVSSPLELRK